jgi:FkbM family methyltransferase
VQPSSLSWTDLLKKILFRQYIKHRRLQRLWGLLHTLSVFGMNYGGGGLIETSGEIWVLSNVIRTVCEDIDAPVVFDVGANVGDYTHLVDSYVPEALIYAFEPARVTYKELIRRVAEAEASNIKPYNIGFSDSERAVDLFSYTVEGQRISLLSSIDCRLPTQVVDVRTDASETIEVQTIDHFCVAEGIDHVDFLKLDVEGHELSVLRGARRLLSAGLISLIQFEFGPANIYSRTFFYDFWSLLSDEYDLYRIVPNGIVPIPNYGENLEVFLTTNYLAIKRHNHGRSQNNDWTKQRSNRASAKRVKANRAGHFQRGRAGIFRHWLEQLIQRPRFAL